jgi:hypothetical protein
MNTTPTPSPRGTGHHVPSPRELRAAAGATIRAVAIYRGTVADRSYANAWRVKLEHTDGRRLTVPEYTAGSGIPVADYVELPRTTHTPGKSLPDFIGLDMGHAYPMTPEGVSSVLSSVILDARSVLDADGFEDWARDFGYDPDSRSAEKMYRACCRERYALEGFLTTAEWDRVAESSDDSETIADDLAGVAR